MTKCQLLKEISELFFPRSDEERKYPSPNFSYPIVGTVQTLFSENLLRVDT